MKLIYIVITTAIIIMVTGLGIVNATEFVFTGSTGTELHTFIDSNGPGVYILASPLTITSTLTLDQSYITVRGKVKSTDKWSPSLGGYIGINMDNGLAINITGRGVTLENICFDVQQYTSTVNMIQIACRDCRIEDSLFYNSNGNAITFQSGSYLAHIEDIRMESNLEYHGTFINFKHTLNSASHHPLDIYIENMAAFNSHIAFMLRSCEGIYFNDIETYHCDYGIVIDPTTDFSVYNIVFDWVNLDSCRNGGSCFYSSGSHSAFNIIIDQLWAYSEPSASRAITLFNVQNIVITDGFISGSSQYNLINIGPDSKHVQIVSNSIRGDTASSTDIYCAGDDVIIQGNNVRSTNNGYSISMVAGSDNYIVTGNLVCSTPVGANNPTHILKDNVIIGMG